MAQQSRSKKSTGSAGAKKNSSGTQRRTSSAGTRSRSQVSSRSTSGRTSQKRTTSGRNSARSTGGSNRRNSYSNPERSGLENSNIIMIVILVVLVFLFLSGFGIMGPIGNAVSGFLFGLFGFPQYIMPAVVVALGVWYFTAEDKDSVIPKIISCVLLLLCFSIICEMISADLKSNPVYNPGDIYSRCSSGKCGGGILAGSITFMLYHFLKQAGTILVLIMFILVAVIILSGKSLSDLIEQTRQNGYDSEERRSNAREPEEDEEPDYTEEDDPADDYGRTGRSRRDESRSERRRSSFDEDEDENELEEERYRRIREEDRILKRREAEEEKERIRREREFREKERAREKAEAAAREKEEKRRALERRELEKNRRESDEILRHANVGRDSYNLSATMLEPAEDKGGDTNPALQSPADLTGGVTFSRENTKATSAINEERRPDDRNDTDSNITANIVSDDNKDIKEQETSPAGYSMAGDLHEITVNDADYSPFTVRADIAAPQMNKESSYSGIAIPTPQETAPDYASDSFSDRIIRQGLEETLHYETAAVIPEEQSASAGHTEHLKEQSAAADPADHPEEAKAYTAFGSSDLHELHYDDTDSVPSGEKESYSAAGKEIRSSMNPMSITAEDDNFSSDRIADAKEEKAETEQNLPKAGPVGDAEGLVPAPLAAEESLNADSAASVSVSDISESAAPEENVQASGTAGREISLPVEEFGDTSMTLSGTTVSDTYASQQNELQQNGTLPGETHHDEPQQSGCMQDEAHRSETAQDETLTDESQNAEIREITVERERSSDTKEGKESIFRSPQDSGYRDNTSGKSYTSIAAAQAARDEADEKARKHHDPYVFPGVNLLKEGAKTDTSETDLELQETAFNLQNTLKTFGVDVTIPQVSQGPAVTRYELLPAEGVKVSKIVSLADDIKLNLAAADIRIEAPIPGKRAIGIEVPNRSPQTVQLRDLFESDVYKQSKANVRFAVGKDIGGNVVVTDITKMPHMLIAGSTGSGKSVCINTLIMSILMTYRPDEVKMIMIDPKIVELSVYNGIPHLLLPVVTDPKKASDSLKWAVAEMTDRFRKFADNSVRDIRGYNDLVRSRRDPDLEIMPRIVIIVDELADLMMVSAKEVEESICRLAQLARAAGIHLIIATQRPSVDVITGLIKANMPSRIAFAVTSGVDSRTILDMNGAEKLLGKGDMLFYPQGYPKPARVQGAFVSDEEVQNFANYLRYHNPTWCETGGDVERKIASMSSGAGDENTASVEGSASGSEFDDHFVEAGYLIIEKQKASIGMLQRVYKIGFNRAARIMDQLCEAGVVSAEEGTKPRKVLMTSSDFESYIEENGI